ncbi:prepilin-type N-terminal cleavage/methylation domain-containing protein, partial [bacterium]|nr:prepilin-type N-terminal cleavage/methylation domain-containing protein [bacterium]
MLLSLRKGRRGFTLVELLIVVAIIGVLSTIGVPTFKRMIQKSKKAEAKVGLGGLYTTEAAFFAEYNGYGNNLAKMGYAIDGAASATYV